MTTWYRTTGYPYGNLINFGSYGPAYGEGLHYRWYPVATPPPFADQNPHGFTNPVQSGPRYTPLPANYEVGAMSGTQQEMQEARPDLDLTNPELEPLWPLLDTHVQKKTKDAAAIGFAAGAIGMFFVMSIWDKNR
jgi:hypothetical protein